jgi:prepilin-type N-terminal cleavage/methylation domain-containing protein
LKGEIARHDFPEESEVPLSNYEPAGQRGMSATELLVVVGVIGVALAVTLPALHEYHEAAKVDAALAQIESSVQQVRISALKERTSHRLLIRDAGDASPNRLELQRWSGISGNPNIFGFLYAEDAIACTDTVNTGFGISTGADADIMYDCLHPPNPWGSGNAELTMTWQEVE